MSDRHLKKEGKSRKHRGDSSASRSRSQSKNKESSSRRSSPSKKKSKGSSRHRHSDDYDSTHHSHSRQKHNQASSSNKQSSNPTPVKAAPVEHKNQTESASKSKGGFPNIQMNIEQQTPMFNPMFAAYYSSGMFGMAFDPYSAAGFGFKGMRGPMKFPNGGTWGDSGSQVTDHPPKNEEQESQSNEKTKGESHEASVSEANQPTHSYFPSRRGQSRYGRPWNGYFGRSGNYHGDFYKGGYSGFNRSSRMMGGMNPQEYYQQMWARMGSNMFGESMMGAAFGMEQHENMLKKVGNDEANEPNGVGKSALSKKDEGEKENGEKEAQDFLEAEAESHLKETKQRNKALEKVGWFERLPSELLETSEFLPLIGAKALKDLHESLNDLKDIRSFPLHKAQKSLKSIEKRLRPSLEEFPQKKLEMTSKEKEKNSQIHLKSGQDPFENLCFWSLKSLSLSQTSGFPLAKPKDPDNLSLVAIQPDSSNQELPTPIDSVESSDLSGSLRQMELLMQKIKIL